MLGNRPSSLDVSLYCPQAARLSTGGAGRAAYVSSVFHALLADDPRYPEMVLRLTESERSDLARRKRPTDCEIDQGKTLRYSQAHREVRIALDGELRWCPPDSEGVLTQGTADAYWDPIDDIVYVADLKATEWTASPDSLQLHCYGWALSDKLGAAGYCPGIWACTEGRWSWGMITYPDSFEGEEVRARLLAAITNTEGPACTGDHCGECWSRLRCPEFLAPAAAVRGTAFSFLENPEAASEDEIREALLLLKPLIELGGSALSAIKAWVRQNGPIEHEGKVWGPSRVAGRKSLDTAAVRRSLGDERYEACFKVGAPHEQFTWRKL